MIEHAGGIVEDKAIYLSDTNNHLKWVTQGVRSGDEAGNDEAERSPSKLRAMI